MSTPDQIRDRLASGYYDRPDVIARMAEALLPALCGEGGQPAPARRPLRSTPPSVRAAQSGASQHGASKQRR